MVVIKPIRKRVYRCTECGHLRVCETNHEDYCWPICKGRCRTIVNPHTERELVLPKSTTHEYVRDFTAGEKLNTEKGE